MLEYDPTSGRDPDALRFVEYDLATGRICSSREMPRDEFVESLISEGFGVIETDGMVDPRLSYVVAGTIVPRPTLAGFDRSEITADGVDVARMDLPASAMIYVDGVPYGPTDEVEIVSSMPATYDVRVMHFPWQDFAAKVTAS